MKSLNMVLPLVLLLVIFNQCDTVSSDAEQNEPEILTQLTNPLNSAVDQPVDVVLAWNRIKGSQTYQLMLSKSETFNEAVIDTTVSGTSYKTHSLSTKTTYHWKVLPIGRGSKSEWSETWSFSTGGNEAPETTELTLLSPENNADKLSTTLKFTWSKLQNTSEYVFQLSDDSAFGSVLQEKTVADTSYVPESLEYQKRYHWRVKAAGDETEWSEVRTFTTGTEENDEEISTIVTLIAPVQNADKISTNLEFSWNAVTGASQYVYQLSDNSTFSSVLHEKTVAGTSYTPDVLEHQKRYHWRVKVAGDGTEWSEIRTFTTGTPSDDEDADNGENDDSGDTGDTGDDEDSGDTGDTGDDEDSGDTGDTGDNEDDGTGDDENTNTVVTLLSPEHNADKVATNLEFSWKAIAGVNEYVYQLSDNSTFSSVLHEKTVAGTTYKPAGLTTQKKYHWRVRVAGDGTEWSEVRTFTTGTSSDDEDTNTVVTLLSPEHNADKVSTDLEFSWKAIAGVNEYVYQLSDNSTFSSVLHEKTVAGTTYKPAGLTTQKKYHWRVRIAGDGTEWSEVRTFTTGTEGDSGNDDSGDADDNEDTSVVPTLLTPQNNSTDISTNVEFVWNELSGITHYQFQLSENSTFTTLADEAIAMGTTYSSEVLTFETKYFWRVKADVAGSEWSEVFSFDTEAEVYTPPSPPPPSSGSFVGVQNANFVQNGEVIRFAGTNAYYLPNYEKLNSGVVDRALNLFQDTGVTVVRMWGFYDGFDCGYSKNDSNENVIQTSPGVYSESALRDLDNVIAKGKDRGISFIIPFVNYWDELGGICQYNTWAGSSNPSTNMEFFISNNQTQKWFKDYISMLLNRVNTVTGIAYKDEPAIFGWQIMNEGRNSGQHYSMLRDWYQEIAQFIKSIDKNHIVSTGEEGFDEGTPSQYSVDQYSNTYALRANEGTSYIANTAIPEIDFGSAHWYPGEFGFGHTVNADFLKAQRAWLVDHKNIAEAVGKPFYIGEFGLAGWGDNRVIEMYDHLYQVAEEIKLDGNLLWQLVADGTKCWEFGGNICYPGGRADTDLYNRFKQHVTNMKGLK